MDDLDLSAVKPLAAPSLETGRACRACRWSCKDGADLTCRRAPPQMTHLAIPVMAPAHSGLLGRGGPNGVPQLAIQVYASWPVVRPDQWCGEFGPKGSH